jgi:hypothetical protein
LVVAAAIVIAPMVVRNYLVSGSLSVTRSGVALYVGNAARSFSRPSENCRRVRRVSHTAPFAHMAEHPLATLRDKALNIAYLLSPWITPYEISGPDTRVRTGVDGVVRVEGALPREGRSSRTLL